jgi:hypothetical protein
MAKSRNRKGHKQKVAARNQKIQAQKNAMKKWQQSMLENLIAQEQAKGMYGSASNEAPLVDPNKGDLLMDGPELG